jgi:hypothetical protein
LRPFVCLLAAAVALTGCATAPHPRQVVKGLDRSDPRFESAACVKARKAARQWDDHELIRTGVAVGGNLAVPYAGTAAAMVLNKRLDRKRKALAHQVARHCVSDPLGGGRPRSGRAR